uniref:Uncharacterized protein n=1 Tax=Chenopodium quinoa TaxID=63459 RepID=A0A803MTK3_CHEQI
MFCFLNLTVVCALDFLCYQAAVLAFLGSMFLIMFPFSRNELDELILGALMNYNVLYLKIGILKLFLVRSDKLLDLGFNIQREETSLDNDEGSIPSDSSNDVVRLLHHARDAFREGQNDEAKKFLRANRKFLPPFHPWHRDKRNFDGKVEERHQPTPLNGIDVAHLLRDFPNEFGKKQKKPRRVVDDPNPWKKRTKDHVSSRQDLVELNLMSELQPRELEDGGEEFPRSRFWMSLEQKPRFLKGSNSATPQINACSTSQSFLPKVGLPIKRKGRTSKKKDREHILDHNQWVQAHRYVLFNCDCEEVEKYISEHKEFVSARGKRKWNSVQDHNKDFVDWFREKVDFIVDEGQDIILNNIIWLSKGPSYIAIKYTRYSVNGFRFHTMKRDANCIKGGKAKASDSQSQLPDYELQRLQKLKYNAERMKLLVLEKYKYMKRSLFNNIKFPHGKFKGSSKNSNWGQQRHL